MAGKSRLPKLALSAEQLSELQQLSQSRTAPLREVQRARILCRYHAGETIAGIARAMETTRKSVRKWIDKALAMGAEAALKDTYHRARPPVITEEARAWVIHLACSKPRDLGYAAELWTRSLLAQHVRRQAIQAGHPSLSRAAKATVQRILAEQPCIRSGSGTIWKSAILPLTCGCGTFCWFIKRLRCRTKRSGPVTSLQSLPFPSMKSRASRRYRLTSPRGLRFD